MILYQDAALVVVNKPAGLSSEAGLPARLRELWGQPDAYVGIVHRLDTGVSGLMVCARTPKAAAALTRQITQSQEAYAVQNLSALLGMSMENAVQTADSMKARGFGARHRTTFHLFRFDARDARTLALILTLSGICVVARCYGHGYMEYYPRITALTMGRTSSCKIYA